MRLLNVNTLRLSEFINDVPRYAILSHRWETDELTFQDVSQKYIPHKQGWKKVKAACSIARKSRYQWIWLDTCCIDKINSVELNEAINAMYKWYENADVCYAYRFDHIDGPKRLRDSSWFSRCWTLQELIAPKHVEFFDRYWKCFGSKEQLRYELSKITGINTNILLGADPRECSVAQRMSWAAGRQATRVEDKAYSLLGLFGLSLPTLYGSGGEEAFRSLQAKLVDDGHNLSILAWDESVQKGSEKHHGLLADGPAQFARCRNTRGRPSRLHSILPISGGHEVDVLTIPYTLNTYLCALDCTSTSSKDCDAILLQTLKNRREYARVLQSGRSVLTIARDELLQDPACVRRTLFVPNAIRDTGLNIVPGIWIRKLELPGYDSESLAAMRIRSRAGGQVHFGKHGDLVMLPPDEWGTAGVMYIPVGSSTGLSHLIRWIKIGFTPENLPMMRLGNNHGKTVRIHREATRDRAAHDRRLWNNAWLTQKLSKRIHKLAENKEEREYSAHEYFNTRSFEQVEARGEKGFVVTTEYLKLKISLVRRDCPRSMLPERKTLDEHVPTRIWTLDIEKTGNFLSANQYLLARALGAVGIGLTSLNHKKKTAELQLS